MFYIKAEKGKHSYWCVKDFKTDQDDLKEVEKVVHPIKRDIIKIMVLFSTLIGTSYWLSVIVVQGVRSQNLMITGECKLYVARLV